jgi:hypothetical protein
MQDMKKMNLMSEENKQGIPVAGCQIPGSYW